MEVDRGRLLEVVGQLHPDAVAEVDVDPGTGDHPVVGHGLLHGPRLGLPLDLVGGQAEHLGPVAGDLGLQRNSAESVRLGREVGHALLVQARHLLGAVAGIGFAGLRVRGGRGLVGHGQGRLHARLGVTGDAAEHPVGARLHCRQGELRGIAGREDVRAVDALDGQVVVDAAVVDRGQQQRRLRGDRQVGGVQGELDQRHRRRRGLVGSDRGGHGRHRRLQQDRDGQEDGEGGGDGGPHRGGRVLGDHGLALLLRRTSRPLRTVAPASAEGRRPVRGGRPGSPGPSARWRVATATRTTADRAASAPVGRGAGVREPQPLGRPHARPARGDGGAVDVRWRGQVHASSYQKGGRAGVDR